MSRTNHLGITIHLFFHRDPERLLNLRKLLDLARAYDRSDRDPEVTFVLGGPDAEDAEAIIRKMLDEVPHISESWAGVRSTKTSKEHERRH